MSNFKACFAPCRTRPHYRMPHTDISSLTAAGKVLDHIAIERVINGDREQPLTAEEKRAAGQLLLKRGTSQLETARLVRVAARTVARWAEGMREAVTA
jgi:hypothetical protein